MKIAILTQPLESNYGGLLQNYALQIVLKRMGHDVLTVNIRRSDSILIWFYESLKVFIKRIIGRNEFYPIFPKHRQLISQHTDRFINNNISVTNKYAWYSKSIQKRYKFDVYIVGSDQTWRPKYNWKIQDMFLNFLADYKVKRIAYAASFGTDALEFTELQRKTCAALAKKFDAISVREDSGVTLCKEYFGVKATPVLDPTMLLPKEDYLSLLSDKGINKNSLVVYILDYNFEKEAIIESISEKLKLKIRFIGNRNTQNPNVNYEERIVPPVEDWLNAFKSARFVFTDSFHGTVFSIIFNKPFICIANPGRGMTRFTSLLNVFGLTERLIYSKEELENTLINDPIDFQIVNEKLCKERSKALSFLSNSLS